MNVLTLSSRPEPDTTTSEIKNRIKAKTVKELNIRYSTTAPRRVQTRTVSSSKTEGRTSLRYSPREPVMCDTSTETKQKND